jgi:hypothetical protein
VVHKATVELCSVVQSRGERTWARRVLEASRAESRVTLGFETLRPWHGAPGRRDPCRPMRRSSRDRPDPCHSVRSCGRQHDNIYREQSGAPALNPDITPSSSCRRAASSSSCLRLRATNRSPLLSTDWASESIGNRRAAGGLGGRSDGGHRTLQVPIIMHGETIPARHSASSCYRAVGDKLIGAVSQ